MKSANCFEADSRLFDLPPNMISFAPGARVVVRDEEWLVRRVDPSSDGGHLLNCDGVSDLVRGRSALFLTKLEGEPQITVLDPAKTELVADGSSHFNSDFLYLEAQLRQSTPNDDRIHLGHRGVMNLTPRSSGAASLSH